MIYLDNSATTKPCKEAVEAINDALTDNWANPSSTHFAGNDANHILEKSRSILLSSIGIKNKLDGKIVFTSCGTEANNMVMFGVVNSKNRPIKNGSKGKIFISNGEHPSIENCAKKLEGDGFTVLRIPTTNGILDLDFIHENADDSIILASIMLVNNETGAVYNVRAASEIIKKASPNAVIHSDCIQAFGKIKFSPSSLKADIITISSHKICGPKGIGAIFINSDIIKAKKITPIIFGGGQEDSRRSGTENMPGIAGFAAATKVCMDNFNNNYEFLKELHDFACKNLSSIEGIKFNEPQGEHCDSIVSIVLPKIKSETMLNYLSARKICVSAGSACSARSNHESLALSSFGVSNTDADSTIRISMNHTNTKEDIIELCKALKDGINSLQKIR